MFELFKLAGSVVLRTSEAMTGLANIENKVTRTGAVLNKFGEGMAKAGTTLTKFVTAPLLGLGVLALKTSMDFEAGMARVQATSQASAEDMVLLREKAKEMGIKTKYSAKQSAEALNYMAMAGWKTKDMLEGLEGMLNLAAASGEDLGLVSDIVTDGLTALGMEAKDSARFADVLAAAASNSNTNVAMLGETLKYAGSVFGTAGYTIKDFAFGAGLMASQSIKASQAGTSLRTGLVRLLSPSKKSAEVMKKYGIEMKETDGTLKSFPKVVDHLRDKFSKLSKAQQIAAADTLFGKYAMTGWLAIINAAPKDFDKLKNAINNSNGAAQNMADIMNNTLKGQITLLKSQLEGLAIQFGDIIAPYIGKLVELLQNLSTRFSKLNPSAQKFIVILGLLAAGVGPLLLALGTLTTVIASVVTVIGYVGLPVVAAIAGFALLVTEVGALILVFTNLARKAGLVSAVIDTLKDIFQLFSNTIKGDFKNASNILIEKFGYSKEEAKNFIKSLSDLRDRLIILGNAFKEIAKGSGNILLEFFKKMANFILDHKKEIAKIIEFITDYINNVLNLAIEIDKLHKRVKNLTSDIKKYLEETFKNLPEIIENFKRAIVNKFNEIKQNIINKLNEWETAIKRWFNSLPAKTVILLKNWGKAIVKWTDEQNKENIRQFGLWWNSIKKWFNSIPGKIDTAIKSWGTSIKKWFDTTKTNIKTKLDNWWTTIKNWFTSRPGQIEKSMNTWRTSIKNKFEQARTDIKNKLDNWWSTIKGWFTRLPNKPEVKNAGRNMVNKVSQGTGEKKKDFMDKLGKLIVDVIVGAGKLAFVAAIATGREIVKRVWNGMKQVNLKQAGRNVVSSVISGIRSKFGELKRTISDMASTIRNYLPFSPAKVGPLKDLNKLNFAGPISDSIRKAKPEIEGILDKLSLNNISANVGLNKANLNGINQGNAGRQIVLQINNPQIFDKRGVSQIAEQLRQELQTYMNFKRG